MRRSLREEAAPIDFPIEDDMASNDEDWNMGEDDGDDDEMVSMASSVPTTVNSATDDRTSASFLAQKRRAQRIFSAKVMMIGIFIVVTITVSVSIYGFATQEENKVLDSEFQSYASQIFDVSNVRMQNLLGQLESMAVSFSSYATGTQEVWPFVIISNFEAQAAQFYELQPSAKSLGFSVQVTQALRDQWEEYSVTTSPRWIQQSYKFLQMDATSIPDINPFIYRLFGENGTAYEEPVEDQPYYSPIWMVSLVNPDAVDLVNYDTLDDERMASVDDFWNESELPATPSVMTPPYALNSPRYSDGEPVKDESTWPQSTAAAAILDRFDGASQTRVATLWSQVSWEYFFQGILHDQEINGPLDLALQDTCGKSYMFSINGSSVVYNGYSDSPILPVEQPSFQATYTSTPWAKNCSTIVHMAPSTQFVDASRTNLPVIYTLAVVAIFGVMALFFWVYDRITSRSYYDAINKVERSKSIVDSFFPSNVRDRVLNDRSQRTEVHSRGGNSSHIEEDGDVDDVLQRSRHAFQNKPIADLHPNVTVLFADVANFTAWASVREPSQVFLLLETLYHSFDKLCRKYRIFKVETIGDCYVAVSGLPEFTENHAVDMARYAQEIMIQMHKIVKQLEVALGPETADLALRIGINSGPVTAGVLRGEKSRFQLFGDTVNTASRMEHTSSRNRIQVSSDTAALLEKAGKTNWLVPREDLVPVKGKGDMKTYWLVVDDCVGSDNVLLSPAIGGTKVVRRSTFLSAGDKNKLSDLDLSSRSGNGDHISIASPSVASPEEKKERLVNWSADLLLGLLKRIVAMRESEETLKELKEFQDIVRGLDEMGHVNANGDGKREPTIKLEPGKTVLDEVAEIISLPRKASRYQQDPNNVDVGEVVVKQLYRFVREIAKMYRDNPFHNFDHASHVTQSLTKLLSRVVAPDEVDYENMKYKKKAATSKLHKFTFGITSDPITQFACAFSSLIHDLDHPGVPNAILVSEGTEIAKHYRNKSVAEQNSVDLAWNLLMEPRFKDLRRCIYRNQSELDRFRQLVVNSVMATDIVDKELGQLRKKRWERAFNKDPDSELEEKATDEVNRKATIVIEHLIQAADVAHTMQHWHVYLKWNERFFHECYAVYLAGRSETDPSIGWYKGEIGFFDFYIIPLAKKLESCGVFGVSSDECLNYAQANRDEWERKGEEIVRGYLSKYKRPEQES